MATKKLNSSIGDTGEWTGKLLYDTDVCEDEGLEYNNINEDNFWNEFEKEVLKEHIDFSAQASDFSWYQCDIESFNGWIKHDFVVFRTSDGWWWSVEKHNEGIHLQRGKDKTDVTLKRYFDKRRGVMQFLPFEASGVSKSMREILEIVHCLLATPYHVLSSNCKDFCRNFLRNADFEAWTKYDLYVLKNWEPD